jgi:hypothetical protein
MEESGLAELASLFLISSVHGSQRHSAIRQRDRQPITGYRNMDFVRVGLPLNFITCAVAITAIQACFPFNQPRRCAGYDRNMSFPEPVNSAGI